MFNIKWGIILGGVAFFIAFAFSLILGNVLLLTALIRALIFAAFFFALGTAAWVLINSFIPELLFPETREEEPNVFFADTSGSKVNIVLGDTSGAALPDPDASVLDEVGNISDLISGKIKLAERDVDQKRPGGYTGNGKKDDFAATEFGPGDFSNGLSGGESAGTEALPSYFQPFAGGVPGDALGDASVSLGDLSGFNGGDPFSAGESDVFGADTPSDTPAPELPERKVSGNRSQAMEGDFNPKEIASGIRTVLEKDKKG